MVSMRRHLPWLAWGVLGVCALIASSSPAQAQTAQPVKPYILFILDTSGSMGEDTGFGFSSCGGNATKLHHAKCAIQNIAANYGEMVMGLARFRQGSTDVTPADGCTITGFACDAGNGDAFELVVPFVDGNQSQLIAWTNFSQDTCTCIPGKGTCSVTTTQSCFINANCPGVETCNLCAATNPEFFASSGTPIAGSLVGGKRYWQGLATPTQGLNWGGSGADPIREDLLSDVFSASECFGGYRDGLSCAVSADCTGGGTCGTQQCRPYITIMMTDGDASCATAAAANTAAASLLTTTVDAVNYRVETKPIGFGKVRNDPEIEAMAKAGGAVDRGFCGVQNATVCSADSQCTGGAVCKLAAGRCSTFGTTPCIDNTQCTVAGETCNLSAALEGAYAQNEEELQLEISSIIADAIKFETCNGRDDDCDILIDEDFKPPLDGACNDGELGVCRDTGVFICNGAGTGVQCNVIDDDTGSGPETTCDGLDNDCDGFVDDGLVCSCGTVEFCNGIDDDCDGIQDDMEGITQPCGTDIGVCAPGVETCNWNTNPDSDPQWVGCTADPEPGELDEVCNHCDDDCDGTVDGFAQECSDWPGGNPDMGLCHPGTQVCPTSAPGACVSAPFGACIGEVTPVTEVCDLQDNDCDGVVDNDTGGEDCSSACGLGTTVCDMGVLECNSVTQPIDDTCNNIDDDCNGNVDEDAPPGGTCVGGTNDGDFCGDNADCPGGGTCLPGCDGPMGQPGTICDGTVTCAGGNYVCLGEGIEPELCNCEDDDCNNVVDEGMLCAVGSTCVHPGSSDFACQCAEPCAAGEFPCGIGRVCEGGFCLVDPCFGVTCTPDVNGDLTTCAGGECERACDSVTCPSPLICFGPTGECEADDCTTFPDRCGSDELCVGGTCVNDPCAGVTCGSGDYCFQGDCVGSCAGVDCPVTQRCDLGSCEPDPCGGACPSGQVCDEGDGVCEDDPCPNQMCPQGEWCNPQNGICEQDPCVGVECPSPDETCVAGTCFGPEHFVDAGGVDADPDEITTGGGGGCGDAGGGGTGLGLVLGIGLALALRQRRRVEVSS